MAEVYEPIYTTFDDVVRLIRANKLRIKMGDADRDNIEVSELEETVRDEERALTGELSRVYTIPDPPAVPSTVVTWASEYVATIALKLSGVHIYRMMYPGIDRSEMPTAVLGWLKDAKDMITKLVSRDIVLAGWPMTGTPYAPSFQTRTVLYDTIRGPDDEEVDE